MGGDDAGDVPIRCLRDSQKSHRGVRTLLLKHEIAFFLSSPRGKPQDVL